MPGPDWPPGPPVVFRDGTYRTAAPEQTWEAIQQAIRVAGISRVADLTCLDDLGIPTAQATRPASLLLSVSQGKAASLTAAKVSAVMESLEAWTCEHTEADIVATAAELGPELCYDPSDLDRPLFSVYHRDAAIGWVSAVTLVTGRRTWVPVQAVRLNVSVGQRWAAPMFTQTTNGLASGNSLDEAALHGLYELIERDCAAHETETARLLDPASVTDPGCVDLLARIDAAGSRIAIADISRDDQHSCFTAQLRYAASPAVFGGAGLHRDPAVALSRAITEAAQSRLTVISGAREDIPRRTYQPMRPGAYLPDTAPAAGAAWCGDYRQRVNTATADLRADLLNTAEAITALTGVEPVAVPLTRDGVDLAVVHVFAARLAFDADAKHGRGSLLGAAAGQR